MGVAETLYRKLDTSFVPWGLAAPQLGSLNVDCLVECQAGNDLY
jgi:hypothetical protein